MPRKSSFQRYGLPVVALIVLAGVGMAVVWHYHQLHTRQAANETVMTDRDRSQDLFVVETAVNKYYSNSSVLPANLKFVKHLKGRWTDYTYNYPSRMTNGGPTISYNLCAAFKSATVTFPVPYDERFGGGEGIGSYLKHRQGLQCFHNDYYKGQSHIGAIYDKDEVAPDPYSTH